MPLLKGGACAAYLQHGMRSSAGSAGLHRARAGQGLYTGGVHPPLWKGHGMSYIEIPNTKYQIEPGTPCACMVYFPKQCEVCTAEMTAAWCWLHLMRDEAEDLQLQLLKDTAATTAS